MPIIDDMTSKRSFLFMGLLTGFTLFVYWAVLRADFVYYDDLAYVVQNPHIRQGINPQSFAWAMTTFYASNWHPLTWMTHMTDYWIFGLNPAGHHAVNLLLHLTNTILLYSLFKRMTGSFWQSYFVAALFALHPLHVESVAWISERKDVLSAFFFFLTAGAYHHYTKEPAKKIRMIPVLIFYTLGLMSKPMLVTMPVIFLLLDYWPLERIKKGQGCFARLIVEKIPLFMLSAGVCLLTFLAQRGLAVVSLEKLPLAERLANSILAYGGYIGKTYWPHPLGILYLYHPIPVWQTSGILFLLAGITTAVLFLRKKAPYLLTGWLWFLITLIPVIGFLKVGVQAMADRYMYLPVIGLFITTIWGAADILQRIPGGKKFLGITGALILMIVTGLSYVQTRTWHDTVSLFAQSIRANPGNATLFNNFGNQLAAEGRDEEAAFHYKAILQVHPDNAPANFNFAKILERNGYLEEAAAHYSAVLKTVPENTQAQESLSRLEKEIGEGRSSE